MSGIGKESKVEKDRQKAIQDKCQAILTQLLRDDDNKYCVDCDAKGPRWASWNLGVFLCIRCAGIHRNLGVHISKVKSVNLDTWTPQQVVTLRQMGNSQARAIYEANLPDTWRRPQTDTSLEAFIRAKYQTKRYIAKEWVPPPTPEVNWDKEIEEEAERLKKRKKEKQVITIPPVRKPLSEATVPPLPKPTSSPKAGRTSAVVAPPDAVKASSAIDLLGLSTSSSSTEPAASNGAGDDSFTSFLSAPAAPAITSAPAAVTEKSDGKGLSTEEESFFNQAVEAKKPLSKDSILALYSNQQAAPQPQMFHAPGMYPANPGYPAANAMFSNGMNPGLSGQQMPAALAANPFFGMSTTGGMPPQHGVPLQHGSSNPPKPSDDLLGDFGSLNLSASTSSLSHQMSGMSLNPQPQIGVAPNFSAMANSFPINNFMTPPQQPPMGQTFTSFLWQ